MRKRMLGGKYGRFDNSDEFRGRPPARHQGGYQHDGYDLDTIIKIKFQADGSANAPPIEWRIDGPSI